MSVQSGNLTLPSHMCVYFAKENSFQVISDISGKFRNKSFANCFEPESKKWRIGEIIKRGEYFFVMILINFSIKNIIIYFRYRINLC